LSPAVRAGSVFTALILLASAAQAQGLAADLYVGRAQYDALAANLGTSNLIAGLRYTPSSTRLLYVTAGAPLDSAAPWWGALGGAARLPVLTSAVRDGRGTTLGAAVGGHGYVFRDALSSETGLGATLEAGAFAERAVRGGRVEARAGWQQYESSMADETTSRGALDVGLRAERTGPISVGADARWVRTEEGGFPALGIDVSGGTGPLRGWAAVERWVASDLEDFGWGAGVAYRTSLADVWASYRKDTRHPLYWNSSRKGLTVGLTRQLGKPPPARVVTPAVRRGGRTVIRLGLDDSPGQVYAAGEFNDWQPAAMRRAGGFWELELDLQAGVYRYAFVDEEGRWFVPDTVAGRMDDGMGGHVALLVVP
jgi:hypothetical protein